MQPSPTPTPTFPTQVYFKSLLNWEWEVRGHFAGARAHGRRARICVHSPPTNTPTPHTPQPPAPTFPPPPRARAQLYKVNETNRIQFVPVKGQKGVPTMADNGKRVFRLPSDMALRDSETYAYWVRQYAKNNTLFLEVRARA